MTNLEMINFDHSDLDATVSVCPDGIGYDIYQTSTGFWLVTCDDLQEVENTLNNCYWQSRLINNILVEYLSIQGYD